MLSRPWFRGQSTDAREVQRGFRGPTCGPPPPQLRSRKLSDYREPISPEHVSVSQIRPSSELQNLLRLFFSQVKILAPRGQKCQNFPRFCFANNSVVFNVRTKIVAPSCSPRRNESNDRFDLERSISDLERSISDLERSIRDLDLRSRSRFDLAMSCRISYDAQGLGEHIGAYPTSLA